MGNKTSKDTAMAPQGAMAFSPRPQNTTRRQPPVVLLLEFDSAAGIAKAICEQACLLYSDPGAVGAGVAVEPSKIQSHPQFDALRYDAVWNCVHEVRLLRLEPKGNYQHVDGNGVQWEDAILLKDIDAVAWCVDRDVDYDTLFTIRTNLMDLRLNRLPSRIGMAIVVYGTSSVKTARVIQRMDIGILGRTDPIEVCGLRPPESQKETKRKKQFTHSLELFLQWVLQRPARQNPPVATED